MRQARNNAELAFMLATPVMNGLEIMTTKYLEPDIEAQISRRVGRGEYFANFGGSLSKAWSTEKDVIGTLLRLGQITTSYDSNKLDYNPHYIGGFGEHMSPWEGGECIENMAVLIDQGLGGPLYGIGNPTQFPTYFWDNGVIPSFESNQHDWISVGLRKAGLKVV